jgi:serine/threonine protein kinase
MARGCSLRGPLRQASNRCVAARIITKSRLRQSKGQVRSNKRHPTGFSCANNSSAPGESTMYAIGAKGNQSDWLMSGSVKENNETFLEYLESAGYMDALDSERIRTEFRRLQANNQGLSMQALLVRKGHFTADRAEMLFQAFLKGEAVKRTTDRRVWKRPTTGPVGVDDSEVAGDNANTDGLFEPPGPASGNRPTRPIPPKPNASDTEKQPTGPIGQAAGRKRPSDVPTKPINRKATRRTTGVVDSDSRPTDDVPSHTTEQGGEDDQWLLHTQIGGQSGDDTLANMDYDVPAGTVIAGGGVTIAQVREQMGLRDDVRLISSKMDSTVAHLQPDSASDRKRYVVIREIARGGMGKVLEVEDTELRRSVALKVLRKELLGRRDVVERFLEEAQITGQLEHPNIVPVHEMGVDGAGNLYFTMKFVEGLSLSELLLKLREGNRDMLRDYSLVKLLDIFIKVCEGIGFAHNRGVIHRDLKPANIMVGKFGEVQVMDWGVAKLVDRDAYFEPDGAVVLTDRLAAGTMHTMVGSIIGTPSYMSPEQANGDLDAMGPQTDIFSLGVILYEMLALRSPWTGRTSDEVLEQVRNKDPVKPSERNPDRDIPAELERLCLRCLEKDGEKRINSVRELEANVRSYIEGRAMRAVKYSYTRLAAKWVSRYKREVIGGVLTILLVTGGILGTAWYMERLDRERVLGLNDDAAVLLERWREHVDQHQFDEAESDLDQARDRFQRVLAVVPDDERANLGLQSIREISGQIRASRVAYEREVASRAELDALLSQARSLVSSATDPLYKEQRLTEAFGSVQAMLALDPGNAQALRLKTDICRSQVEFALERSRPDSARFWIEQWRTTGLDEEQRQARLRDVSRLRAD